MSEGNPFPEGSDEYRAFEQVKMDERRFRRAEQLINNARNAIMSINNQLDMAQQVLQNHEQRISALENALQNLRR